MLLPALVLQNQCLLPRVPSHCPYPSPSPAPCWMGSRYDPCRAQGSHLLFSKLTGALLHPAGCMPSRSPLHPPGEGRGPLAPPCAAWCSSCKWDGAQHSPKPQALSWPPGPHPQKSTALCLPPAPGACPLIHNSSAPGICQLLHIPHILGPPSTLQSSPAAGLRQLQHRVACSITPSRCTSIANSRCLLLGAVF